MLLDNFSLSWMFTFWINSLAVWSHWTTYLPSYLPSWCEKILNWGIIDNRIVATVKKAGGRILCERMCLRKKKGDSPLSLSVLLLLLLLSLLLLLWYAEPRKSRTPNIDREREKPRVQTKSTTLCWMCGCGIEREKERLWSRPLTRPQIEARLMFTVRAEREWVR